MSFPIMNPPVPYDGPVQGPIQHGTMIFINGAIPYGANRFSFNLQCGSGSYADVALHFNPRFEGTNAVIRNTKQSNSWGSEERHGVFPFQQGMQFECIILVQSDCYKIAVNGQHFTEFRHRMPMERVTSLSIEGNVQLSSIRYQQPSGYPAAAPPAPAGMVGPPQPAYNPPVPHETRLQNGVYPGRMIYISGHVKHNPHRMTVNLKCSQNRDLAMHFDVRFNHNGERNVVVRNAEVSGRWGSEERHISHFPFSHNANFDMIIMCEGNSFKVAVNNRHFIEFNHRVRALHLIDTLTVDGDVALTQVRYQ